MLGREVVAPAPEIASEADLVLETDSGILQDFEVPDLAMDLDCGELCICLFKIGCLTRSFDSGLSLAWSSSRPGGSRRYSSHGV